MYGGNVQGMTKVEESRKSRYQLRYAAGEYWILDMEQEGVPYKKPLSVNEIGAAIWKMMVQDMGQEEIADSLCLEYQAEREIVLEDIGKFQKMLQEFGLSL